MKINQKGFSVIEILIVVVIVGLIGAVGWLVYDRQKSRTSEKPVTQSSNQQKEEAKTADPNEGYLVVKEWGLRFKVPSTLIDVRYRVHGDIVAFYAKPAGYTVEYRSDYEKLRDGKLPQYATGSLYRSNESLKAEDNPKQTEGKKIGNYYYYTDHAFSSLATGAAPRGLYFDTTCDQDTRLSAKCDQLMEAENKAFWSINQGDTALLNTIEPAQ